MRRRVVHLVVDPEHERHVRLRRRRRDHDFLRSGFDVLLRAFTVGEEARRLEHDVDRELVPGQRGRIALREELELEVPGPERVVAEGDVFAERPEGRVVAQQVRHGLRVPEVVRRDDLEVAAAPEVGAKEVAPDAAEPVDTYANLRHGRPLRSSPASLLTCPSSLLRGRRSTEAGRRGSSEDDPPLRLNRAQDRAGRRGLNPPADERGPTSDKV
jgi:hypothetical protein